jgi:hypothetical protein
MPSNMFSSVPFYIYGDRFAIIKFTPEPHIYVIKNSAIAHAYTLQFEAIWNMSKTRDSKKAV